jgi:two-component system, LytTR family, sensor histidine kinase AlgZ
VHPILSRGRNLILYLASWTPIVVFVTILLSRDGAISAVEAEAIAFPMCAAYAFVCLSSWYLCRVTPLREGNVGRIAATFGAASLVTTTAWLLVIRLWVLLLDSISIFPGLNDRYVNQNDRLFFFGILLFLLAAAVHYLLLMVEESRQVEKQALELQVLAREAELKTLRAQIDPHFLFNSLNSISALTTQDALGARRMCLLLADFLRRSLQLSAKERISFGDELKLAESFLDIEKVRFGERLGVDQEIDPDCHSCMVPPLLIQPLIENAVTHGIAPMIEGGTLKIHAGRSGSSLEIVLENPFDENSSTRAGTGVGLNNVRDRLKKMFGAEGRMDVQRAGSRFRVKLRFPCVS